MTTPATTLSRSDRGAMYVTVVLGVAGAVATAWTAIARLGEVFSGRPVPVLVPFLDETAQLPIGPDGALVDVEVDQAFVTAADPAPATFFAIAAQPIVLGVAILAGIVLLCAVCIQLARGRAFTSANVRLVWTGAAVLGAGWLLNSLFTTMAVNGTLAAVSDRSYDGVLFSTDLGPAFAFLALGAVGAAFQIGHKLQRETEGLV